MAKNVNTNNKKAAVSSCFFSEIMDFQLNVSSRAETTHNNPMRC
nr:MAG TPA: hypothetical protein [Bacteriophage sp.]